MLAADISPHNFEGKRALPVVTATLLEAMPSFAVQSKPYTFRVTATFDGNYHGINENTASATLRINYVSLSVHGVFWVRYRFFFAKIEVVR